MEAFLDTLREQSLYIKLKSDSKFGGAVDIDSLLKALNSLNVSYKNFLKTELKKNQSSTNNNRLDKELKLLIEDSQLLIVDLDFASFGAALTPNTVTHKSYYSFKDIKNIKKESFENYIVDVIKADYNDESFIKTIANKYTPEERNLIYKPVFDNIINQNSFKFSYGNSKASANKLIKKPSTQSKLLKIVPKLDKFVDLNSLNEEKMYAIYVTSSNENDLFGKKPKYSKVLATERLDHPVYPYQFEVIQCDEITIFFKEKMNAHVSFEEELFNISLPKFNIHVWGDTREEAEDAFDFSFCSLVENLYLENDELLTKKALQIKANLDEIIKEVRSI